MKTPKEKAQELVQKYFDEVTNHMQWEEAKECALVCVDEILGTTKELLNIQGYWNDVKKEIESL